MPKTVAKPLLATLYSGYIGQGKKVDEFETKLANYIGNPNAVTVNSATSGLHLAMHLAGIKPGDEVITTPLTCTATNWPILAAGGTIVWADINPKNANIDPEDIRRKISKKTKAIIIVDWAGMPTDIDSIRKFSKNIPIIEDAAHGFGSIYKGKKVGSKADFTVFSFQAIKHITTIDGGVLFTKSASLYEKAKLIRWYGIDRTKKGRESRIEQDIQNWGYKFHMNDVAATIGIEQMKFIEKILKKHRGNAQYYNENLKNVSGVQLLEPTPDSISSNWIYTMKVKNRDAFQEKMAKKGIMTSQVHRRNDTHPVVKKFKKKLPNLDKFEKEMISIPVGWWLSEKEKEYIVKTIKGGW